MSLLEAIIEVTNENNTDQILEVSSSQQLYEIAKVIDSKKKNSPTLSYQEQFHFQLYYQILDEIGFLFGQLGFNYEYGSFSIDYFEQIEQKLDLFVNAFLEGKQENIFALQACFETTDEDLIAGAIYTLASASDLDLQQALLWFARAEIDQFSGFILGLSQAKNPSLSKYLLIFLEAGEVEFQMTCLQILSNRMDIEISALKPFLAKVEAKKDTKLLHQVHLLLSSLGEFSSTCFFVQIFQDHQVFFFEESLQQVLLHHSEGLQLCRFLAKTALEKHLDSYGISLLYLAIAGDANDVSLLQKGCNHPFKSLRAYAIQAIGYLGIRNSIPFLIDCLEKEDTEENKTYICQALEHITQAKISPQEEDESLDTDSPDNRLEDWKNWWQLNQNLFSISNQEKPFRFRDGKKLILSSCIDTMENVSLCSKQRKLAWLELVIRTHHYIHFDPLWSVSKQKKSIQNWRKWGKKHPLFSFSIWQYRGKDVETL